MPSHPRSRRASYAALLAIVLVLVLGLTAWSVDIAVIRMARQQLQAGVDASAIAGASHIDGTSDGLARARAAALATAQANVVRGEPVNLAPNDLVFGIWQRDAQQFAPSEDVRAINALQVQTRLQGIPTPFARVAFAFSEATVDADAVAVRPPPEPIARSYCFLPIAVPVCTVDAMPGSGQGVVQIQLANDGSDTAGWAHPEGPNAARLKEAMEDAATGDCADSMPVVAEGDPIGVTNGVDASVLHDVRNLLRSSAQPWRTDLWGVKPPKDANSDLTDAQYPSSGVIQGPVPVVDAGGCGNPKFNQEMPVKRLVWGVIFDVYSGPGSHKGIQLTLDFEHEYESPGTGNGSGNVEARGPGRLVR